MTGRGTTTAEHCFRVDPNDVRTLDRGEVVISAGQAERARISEMRPRPEMVDLASRLLGFLGTAAARKPKEEGPPEGVLEYWRALD